MNSKYHLVTGGAGYIGSNMVIRLIEKGDHVVIIDNLTNSSMSYVKNIMKYSNKIIFHKLDLLNLDKLIQIVQKYQFDSIFHFAALKSIPESNKIPYKYLVNNFLGTRNILEIAKKFNISKFIFSSTAALYSEDNPPYDETSKLKPINPYSLSKFYSEKLLIDESVNNTDLSVAILRYFNPGGCHKDFIVGEFFSKKSTNILSSLWKSYMDKSKFKIFGNDYDTADGSCLRDYIHISDLIDGHLLANEFLNNNKGLHIFNLGTGQPTSVKELIKIYIEVNQINIDITECERRQGDVAVSFAKINKAKELLSFSPKKSILDICADSFNYQRMKQL